MLKSLKPFIRTGIVLGLLVWLLPTVEANDWISVALASIVLTILYKGIRPLLKLLFLPLNIVTLGFFSIVINVGLLWLMTFIVPTFHVYSMIILGVGFGQFVSLFIISCLISFLSWVVSWLV